MKVIWSRTTYKGKVKQNTSTQDITNFVSKLTWSGASTQASRQVSISLANDPYDKNMNVPKVRPGDIIKVYAGKEKNPRFIGRVPNRQLTSDIGTIEIIAYDYMHNMISSTMTKKFKNKTPEYITKAVLADVGMTAGKIAKTGQKIKKFYPSQMSPYDIIIAAYRKVKDKTGKQYFLRMNGTKFEVIEKGEVSSVILEEKVNVFKSNYEESSDDMVNKVVVYRNNKKVNTVKNDANIKRYGVVQQTITVDKGKGKKEAKNTLKGISKTASISTIGEWGCTAGKAVHVKDSISGITGKYWIKNDTHTFENGMHTMDLDLEFKNVMESVSVQELDTKKNKKNKTSKNSSDKYIYKTKKKKATFTAYYPGEGGEWLDSHDRKLVAAKMTCAAARSIAFNTKLTVKGTGTKYDGNTYKVTDRPKHDILNGRCHVDLLLSNAAECNAFGVRPGYILTKKKVKNPNYKSNSKADKVVKIAKKYLGKVKYLMGAKNVPGGVSDCSGFTKYCFSRLGIDIGDGTANQVNAGKHVSKGKRKKGDIVIFQGTYRAGPSHVGILVSKNKFIHCSSGAGNVVISDLNGSYYVQHFHSIRRVL